MLKIKNKIEESDYQNLMKKYNGIQQNFINSETLKKENNQSKVGIARP